MDGWAETYYRTEEDYKARKNKVLPYAVNCKYKTRIGLLTKPLREAGFTYAVTCSGTPNQLTSFLINLEFKKYAKIPYPVNFENKGNKVYDIDEFLKEILEPYLAHDD